MRRYLVVANQTLGSNELYKEVRACLASGPCAFHIVVPATPPTEHLTWTEGEAHALARDRLERALSWFRELPTTVEGEVGDANPMLAIWDVLRAGQFDHIIISTLPPGLSRWLKMDLSTRVRTTFGLPVTDVVSALSR
jgi:GABA permease